MRRIAISFVVLVAGGVFWLLAAGSGSGTGPATYWVELDNAFGLVSGADVKVAGVRAGSIGTFKLDRSTYRALVAIKLDQKGFDQFRTDAFCESKPQSLIGEYFLDCQPGAHGDLLKANARIPVAQTASTVGPDLVNNILRLPYRQRLRIIINELGAGVAGQGATLNDALRRAVPALRDTDRVLALLAQENHTLADLVTQGDAVITPLAQNHTQIGRWVVQTNRTAQASAQRRVALAQTFQKLPGFLAQLRPAMAALGQVATTQTPALQNLNATSGQLTRFFNDLGPFAKASTPAIKALGQASITGRQAVRAANPTIAQLNAFSTQAPEVGKNLAVTLQHLNDPQFAVETDPRAKAQHADGRPNYTGLEALLQYVFDQSQSINIFDATHYILKVSAFADTACSPYADAKTVNAGGQALLNKCSGNIIGPNSPGLYGQPDISDNGAKIASRAQAPAAARSAGSATSTATTPPPAGTPTSAGAPGASNGAAGAAQPAGTGGAPTSPVAGSAGSQVLPAVAKVLQQASGAAGSGSTNPGQRSVLNYLLGP